MELDEYIDYLTNQIEIAKTENTKQDSISELNYRINNERIKTFSDMIEICKQLKNNSNG